MDPHNKYTIPEVLTIENIREEIQIKISNIYEGENISFFYTDMLITKSTKNKKTFSQLET